MVEFTAGRRLIGLAILLLMELTGTGEKELGLAKKSLGLISFVWKAHLCIIV